MEQRIVYAGHPCPIPTIIEEVLATLIQYVDTAMVGQLGEQATASVSVSTTVTWLVNSVPHAIGIGVLALIAKAVGSGDKNLVRRISSQAVWMVIGCSIVLGGISLLLSPYIPIWMGAEASIQGAAGEYFFTFSLPMLFRVPALCLEQPSVRRRTRRLPCSSAWVRILSMQC